MKGIPAFSEEACLARDLVVLKSVKGAKFHAAHMSTRGSIELIRRAKHDGLPVTAETAPHYLCLEDKDLETYNTNLKINPPLRGHEDRLAMIEALKDGTMDCIASDHAPHAAHEKQVEFNAAPNGSVGLETMFPLVVTHLVRAGHMSLPQALASSPTAPRNAWDSRAERSRAARMRIWCSSIPKKNGLCARRSSIRARRTRLSSVTAYSAA